VRRQEGDVTGTDTPRVLRQDELDAVSAGEIFRRQIGPGIYRTCDTRCPMEIWTLLLEPNGF